MLDKEIARQGLELAKQEEQDAFLNFCVYGVTIPLNWDRVKYYKDIIDHKHKLVENSRRRFMFAE